MSPQHLILTGMPGAGKTCVGRSLARILGREFVDLDLEIDRLGGRSPAEILREDGEDVFRRLETNTLERVLGREAPLVVALGGGTIVTAAARERLRPELVVFLEVDLSDLVARVTPSGSARRPLLGADPRASMAELLAAREPWYRETATISVAAGAHPDAVALGVLEALAAIDVGAGAPQYHWAPTTRGEEADVPGGDN